MMGYTQVMWLAPERTGPLVYASLVSLYIAPASYDGPFI